MVKRLVQEEGQLVGGVTIWPDGWDRYRTRSWMQW